MEKDQVIFPDMGGDEKKHQPENQETVFPTFPQQEPLAGRETPHVPTQLPQPNPHTVPFKLIALGLAGLLVGAGVAYFAGQYFGHEQAVEVARQAQFEPVEDLNQFSTPNGFVESNQAVPVHQWTLDELYKLTYATRDHKGISADQLVAIYGYASRQRYKGNELELTWYNDESRYSVTFYFRKEQDNYYLMRATADTLPGYQSAFESKDWTENQIRNLKIGDDRTGLGGEELSTILDTERAVSDLTITSQDENSDTDATDEVSSTVKAYLTAHVKNGDYQTLTFIRQEDGTFLLSGSKSKY